MDELLAPPTLATDAGVALDDPDTRAELRRRVRVPVVAFVVGVILLTVALVTPPDSVWAVVHAIAVVVFLPSFIVSVVGTASLLRTRWILGRHPWRRMSLARSAGSPVATGRRPGPSGAYETGAAVPRRFDADVAGHLAASNRWGRRAVMRRVGTSDLAVVTGPRPDPSEPAAPAVRPVAEIPWPEHLLGEDGVRHGPDVVIVHIGGRRSSTSPCGVWLIDGRCVGRVQRRAGGLVFLDTDGGVVLEREDRTSRRAVYLVGEDDIGACHRRRLELDDPVTTWTVDRRRRHLRRHRLLESGAVIGQGWRLGDAVHGESALLVLDRHLAPLQRAAATLELVTMLQTLPVPPT